MGMLQTCTAWYILSRNFKKMPLNYIWIPETFHKDIKEIYNIRGKRATRRIIIPRNK